MRTYLGRYVQTAQPASVSRICLCKKLTKANNNVDAVSIGQKLGMRGVQVPLDFVSVLHLMLGCQGVCIHAIRSPH